MVYHQQVICCTEMSSLFTPTELGCHYLFITQTKLSSVGEREGGCRSWRQNAHFYLSETRSAFGAGNGWEGYRKEQGEKKTTEFNMGIKMEMTE